MVCIVILNYFDEPLKFDPSRFEPGQKRLSIIYEYLHYILKYITDQVHMHTFHLELDIDHALEGYLQWYIVINCIVIILTFRWKQKL